MVKSAFAWSQCLSTLSAAALLACVITGLCSAAARAAQPEIDSAAVKTLLVTRCRQCHGPDKQEGGLRLDSRASALTGGDSGPALVPGDADASLMVKAVRQTHESLAMPPKEKLTATEVALMTAWVKAGAAWPEFTDEVGSDGAPGDVNHRLGDAWTDINFRFRQLVY